VIKPTTNREKTRGRLLEAVASSKPVVAQTLSVMLDQKSSIDNGGAGNRATQRRPLHRPHSVLSAPENARSRPGGWPAEGRAALVGEPLTRSPGCLSDLQESSRLSWPRDRRPAAQPRTPPSSHTAERCNSQHLSAPMPHLASVVLCPASSYSLPGRAQTCRQSSTHVLLASSMQRWSVYSRMSKMRTR
jgi:hypothetical protein